MNEHQLANNHQLQKNKPAKINMVDKNLAIESTTQKFTDKVLKKNFNESKDKPTFYDELHYGNYE